ncbi:MAG: ribbon-helix-helix protein, CopG family [Deltaproteobacteria bacterium]|nr:ribbon-helix-helix protein, CopG family [Deltaproteobacteria bacterium]
MARVTKTITLSLPPEMAEKIEEIMKEEGRTRSELLREAVRRYAEEREWKKIYHYGELKARERGITEDQIEDIIDAHRR